METAIYGFFLGLSLIIAIGSQNAFVLRQGILGQHVFWICFICALSDALLIGIGVIGFHAIAKEYPIILTITKYVGAAFLIGYGLQKAISSYIGLTQKTFTS